MKHRLIAAVITLVMSSFALSVPTNAAVGDGAQVVKLQAAGNAAITKRLNAIATSKTQLTALQHVSKEDVTALNAKLDATTTGLTALKANIAVSTTVKDLAPLVQSIVTQYRVYVVLLPQVHNAAAADTIAFGANTADAAASTLDAIVSTQKTQGKDVSAASALLATAHAEANKAKTEVNGQAAKALALTPGDYPNNKSSLSAIRTANAAGSKSLAAALNSLNGAEALLNH